LAAALEGTPQNCQAPTHANSPQTPEFTSQKSSAKFADQFAHFANLNAESAK
jgi:hypothetical protein